MSRLVDTAWNKSLDLALGDLGGLDSGHLLHPSLGRLRLLHGAQVVSRETRDAHVVVALEHQLDVANLQGGGGTKLGQATSSGDHVVNKVVRHLKNELG